MRIAARRMGLSMSVSVLCVLAGGLVSWSTPASALTTHAYLSQITGVPAGPFTFMGSMAFDSGHLWMTESLGGTIAEFDSSGGFVSQFGAGIAQEPGGESIAVGHAAATGEVLYVGSENVVTVVSPVGALLGTWNGGDTPSVHFGGGGERNGAAKSFTLSVAADVSKSLSDWAAGDVYVDDQEERVVDVFEPEAGGKEKYVTQITGLSPGEPFASTPEAVAVDGSNGDVLVVENGAVDVFAPTTLDQYELVHRVTGTPEHPFTSLSRVAVDGGNGDFYVVEEALKQVDQFSAAGVYLGNIQGTTPGVAFNEPVSVAVDPEAPGDVYVGDQFLAHTDTGVVDVFGPDVVLPDVTTGAVSAPKVGGVTLNGTVNPDEAGAATCWFEWGTSTSFGHTAPCLPEGVSNGSGAVAVQATLSGLEPDATYYYRLQASNAAGTNTGEASEDRHFKAPGPGVSGESPSDVRSTSATLDAQLDPNGAPTSYYFQYGTTSAYGSDAPVLSVSSPDGQPIGSGEGYGEVVQHVQGLQPGVVYHFRVVAVSEVSGEPDTVFGSDQTFTTQAAGGAFALLDGRQWELVSPPDKHGSLIRPIRLGVIQAAADGGAFTYLAIAPTETEPAGTANFGVQVFSTLGSGGWSSKDIATPHNEATSVGLDGGYEYRFFSSDLSLGLVEPQGPFTPLSGEEVSPEATERTEYVRNDLTCQATPATCYRPLLTAANVPPGTKFGVDGPGGIFRSGVQFLGATPDLSHVVLASEEVQSHAIPLTSAPGDSGGLYEWMGGHLTLVSLLPGGEDENSASFGGPGENNQGLATMHAISKDGSRVFWTAYGGGRLYLRDLTRGETIEIGGAGAVFEDANAEGSLVFFSGQECEVGLSKTTGKLECAVVGKDGSVVGASEDGSYVYFIANGSSLYVAHNNGTVWSTPTLIATLSGEDRRDWEEALTDRTSRVSPNGRYIAFMSQESLTGYDNKDVTSEHAGERMDEEVFLYDAVSNKLVCASCNPTGARPSGVRYQEPGGINDSRLVGGDRVWEPSTWLAANIPGWTPLETKHSDYQSRYLSDSGRLFFNSSDALVPQDVNGTEDVYEYEPPGLGGCTAGSVTFSERSGGCVDLVSSGTSAEESAFLDASETGGDVFFLTSSNLVSQDYDTSLDVYDARECAPASRCLTLAPVAPPSCSTGDSCKAAPSSQPAIFGSPPSATFSGAGNVIPALSNVVVQRKGLSRARKLAAALKACRKKPKRSRASCRARAKKHYAESNTKGKGASKSANANTTKKGYR